MPGLSGTLKAELWAVAPGRSLERDPGILVRDGGETRGYPLLYVSSG